MRFDEIGRLAKLRYLVTSNHVFVFLRKIACVSGVFQMGCPVIVPRPGQWPEWCDNALSQAYAG